MTPKRAHRVYDHRVVQLVRESSDISTAADWIRRNAPAHVAGVPGLDSSPTLLRVRIAKLERRGRLLTAALRVVLVVLRMSVSGVRVNSFIGNVWS